MTSRLWSGSWPHICEETFATVLSPRKNVENPPNGRDESRRGAEFFILSRNSSSLKVATSEGFKDVR